MTFDYGDVLLRRPRRRCSTSREEFWNPGKTQFWIDAGVDLVIDRREGYFI